MNRIQLTGLLCTATLLAACAHQPGAEPAGTSRAFDDTRDQDTYAQRQDDRQRCQAMTPSAGQTAGGRELALTDCDMEAVDRALSGQALMSDEASSTSRGLTDTLGGRGVQRLPTSSRRLGL